MEHQISKRKILLILCSVVGLIMFIVLGSIYFSPERTLIRNTENGFSQVAEEVNKNQLFQSYAELDRETVNYVEESKKLEAEAATLTDQFSMEAGILKVMLYDSLSEIDRKKNADGLKEIANEVRYPAIIRSMALNFLVGDYELDLIEKPNFPLDLLFVGDNFANLLTESDGDVELAIRELNERSLELFPNPLAAYRIAKWYAGEIYKNKDASPGQKNSLLASVNTYVSQGDTLFDVVARQNNILTPKQMVGLMYELKARINDLSGGDIQKTRELFEKSNTVLNSPPVTVHQLVYMGREWLYYTAFLMRNNLVTPEYIQDFLQPLYTQYFEGQEPSKRNVRTVSRLIAARDSTRLDYPALDYNKTDIENLYTYYPNLGKIIQKLSLREYVKGHPLELSLFGTITTAPSSL